MPANCGNVRLKAESLDCDENVNRWVRSFIWNRDPRRAPSAAPSARSRSSCTLHRPARDVRRGHYSRSGTAPTTRALPVSSYVCTASPPSSVHRRYSLPQAPRKWVPIAVIIEPVLSLQAKDLRLAAMMVRRCANHRLAGASSVAEPTGEIGSARRVVSPSLAVVRSMPPWASYDGRQKARQSVGRLPGQSGD